MNEILQVALAILGSIGAGGAIVFGLSSFLGKVWAHRLMASDSATHERELAKLRADLQHDQDSKLRRLESELALRDAKTFDVHQAKLTAYRLIVDIVAELIADLTSSSADPTVISGAVDNFAQRRLKLYGYLAMVAPQTVMDAHDRLMDRLFEAVYDKKSLPWPEFRALAIDLINEMRKDIGVDPNPIEYRGSR